MIELLSKIQSDVSDNVSEIRKPSSPCKIHARPICGSAPIIALLRRATSASVYDLYSFFADFGIKEFVSDGKITQTGAVDKEQEKDY